MASPYHDEQAHIVVCVGCKHAIRQPEQLSCQLCNSKYDLMCANITAEQFLHMNNDVKCSWQCPECRSRQPKLDNTNTPIRCTIPATQVCDEFITPSDFDMSYNITQRRKHGKLPQQETSETKRQTSEDMLDIDPGQEISLFWKELRAARIEMSNLRTTLADLTAAFHKSNERIDELEVRIDSLEGKYISRDQSNISNMEAQIVRLKEDLQERDQHLLCNDIEIAGIPEERGEGTTHIILSLAAKLGVQLEERDIVDSGRVGPQRPLVEGGPAPRPRTIVVRVTRRSKRDELLKAARIRRGVTTAGMGITGPPSKMYVNERLTKLNKQLFHKAREIAGRVKWRFVWSRNGKIYTRQENGSTRHQLRSESDLTKVFGNYAVGPQV